MKWSRQFGDGTVVSINLEFEWHAYIHPQAVMPDEAASFSNLTIILDPYCVDIISICWNIPLADYYVLLDCDTCSVLGGITNKLWSTRMLGGSGWYYPGGQEMITSNWSAGCENVAPFADTGMLFLYRSFSLSPFRFMFLFIALNYGPFCIAWNNLWTVLPARGRQSWADCIAEKKEKVILFY